MRQSIHDFITLMSNWLGVSRESFEQGLFSALVVGFLFATVHLLTMVVTRWGDHNATSKSLIFSFAIHASCGLGLLVFAPEPIIQSLTEEIDPVHLQNVIVEGEEQTRNDKAGNTPVTEELPDMTKTLARFERLPEKLEPSQIPEKQLDKKIPRELQFKDAPQLPEETPSLPQKIASAEKNKRLKDSAIPMKAENPEWKTGEKVSIPSRSRIQRKVVQSHLSEQKMTRLPQAGAVDRTTPQFKPSQKMSSLNAQESPESSIKRDPTSDDQRIIRREGPTAVIADTDITGKKEGVEQGGGLNVAPQTPKLSRTRMKTKTSLPESTLTRQQSTATPTMPLPTKPLPLASIQSPNFSPSPDVMTPNLKRPSFNAIRKDETAKIPATYRLRNLSRRREIARQFGGTDASERAVEASLKWFASIQEKEGYWDGSKHGSGKIQTDENNIDRRKAGIKADTGLTALTVLAFLGAGYTNEEGKYASQVDKAIKWLVSKQRDDGYLGGDATFYAGMYCHGMAAYALAESYGMMSDPESDPELRKALTKAVNYTVKLQGEGGGWRYTKGWEGDMSMFGWHLMAIKSAQIAGIPVPKDAKKKLQQFLTSRSMGSQKGLAAYRRIVKDVDGVRTVVSKPTAAMTAEALFCKQMLGLKRSDSQSKQAVEYIMRNQPKQSDENLYYWYYGTLAMYQYGGESWKKWNEGLRGNLVQSQVKGGKFAGSWEPRGPWGGYGGRVYSTAIATLSLEVYYRFLPLYQVGGRYQE